MNFLKNKLIGLALLTGLIYGCKNDDGISVALQNEVNEFVWFAMNDYYYWVDGVDDLSTEKYPTYNALYSFLNTYNRPESLFDDLLHPDDLNITSGRPFSWFVTDYEELEASFQGTSKSFGYEYRLLNPSGTNQVYGYVKYVVPTGNQVSPAAEKGLERGDIFVGVNGQDLTINNYQSLLSMDQYTLNMAAVIDGVVTPTDESISLTAVENFSENPILVSKTLEVEGMKVGYLMYNQFVNNSGYHNQLNQKFADFKTDQVTDLVLDLRYNPGGSVTTAQILASLIYGNGTTNTVFTTSRYNENIEAALASVGSDPNDYFINKIPDTSTELNRLSINRVFILTSGNTASASELIISGLDPYLDVTLIGTKTVGKNLGSVTLYDSPNYAKTPADSKTNHTNPNHKNALQPIIARFTNIDDIDYKNGFLPDIEIDEKEYLEDLKPLGDPGEPLLAEALSIITGTARVERLTDNGMQTITDSRSNKTYLSTILIDTKEVPKFLRDQFFTEAQ